ncbi:hypothetical protein ACXR6G_19005 [Ancylomarina sp. YFZ004]
MKNMKIKLTKVITFFKRFVIVILDWVTFYSQGNKSRIIYGRMISEYDQILNSSSESFTIHDRIDTVNNRISDIQFYYKGRIIVSVLLLFSGSCLLLFKFLDFFGSITELNLFLIKAVFYLTCSVLLFMPLMFFNKSKSQRKLIEYNDYLLSKLEVLSSTKINSSTISNNTNSSSKRKASEKVICAPVKFCALFHLMDENNLITSDEIIKVTGGNRNILIQEMFSHIMSGELVDYKLGTISNHISVKNESESDFFYDKLLGYLKMLYLVGGSLLESKKSTSQKTNDDTTKLLSFLSDFEITKAKRLEMEILLKIFCHFNNQPNVQYFRFSKDELAAFKQIISTSIDLK